MWLTRYGWPYQQWNNRFPRETMRKRENVMIGWEVYQKIRDLRNSGQSLRKASSELGISRKTVTRYCDGAHYPEEPIKHNREENYKKEEVTKKIETYIENNKDNFKGKQRLTIQVVHKYLETKYNISYMTVKRYMEELNLIPPKKIFIPLEFEPGDVMQVDWVLVNVFIDGIKHTLPVFVAVLAYSFRVFAMVMSNQSCPNFIYGHLEAFKYFSGVPRRIFYDNLRTAVKEGVGKEAIKQKEFKNFEAHYGFKAVFMNANAGNEKGLVENACKAVKNFSFTPIKRKDSLIELHHDVLADCNIYNYTHKIQGKPLSIDNNYEIEKNLLRKLPIKEYLANEITPVKVDHSLLFDYDKRKYSVPPEYVNKHISIKVYPYTIEGWYQGKHIVTHDRSLVENSATYIPEHYRNVLNARPRSINNAAPLIKGYISKELEAFLEYCDKKDRNKIILDLMNLEATYGPEVVYEATKKAIILNKKTVNAVRNLIVIERADRSESINDTEGTIKLSDIKPINNNPERLSDYDFSIKNNIAKEKSNGNPE
jgi:transposase